MRNLFRKPLTWMVIGEGVVVAALILVAWNVIASAVQPAAAAPGTQSAGVTSDSGATPSPGRLPVARPGARTQLPWLNLESVFWRLQLSRLNRDQALLEQLEWRIVHSAMEAAQRYLETVVLPSLAQAERGGG